MHARLILHSYTSTCMKCNISFLMKFQSQYFHHLYRISNIYDLLQSLHWLGGVLWDGFLL